MISAKSQPGGRLGNNLKGTSPMSPPCGYVQDIRIGRGKSFYLKMGVKMIPGEKSVCLLKEKVPRFFSRDIWSKVTRVGGVIGCYPQRCSTTVFRGFVTHVLYTHTTHTWTQTHPSTHTTHPPIHTQILRDPQTHNYLHSHNPTLPHTNSQTGM